MVNADAEGEDAVIQDYAFDEVLRIYQWTYPEEAERLDPGSISEIPHHFTRLLKLNSKEQWMRIIQREHGVNLVNIKVERR